MKKNDILLVIIVLAIALVGMLGMKWYQTQHSGDTQVVIKHRGVTIKTYPLTSQLDETFLFVSGDETNTIVIKNGIVTVNEANCKDQICVKTRSISLPGEIIVCLPHQLTVEVFSKVEDDVLDSVVN